MKKGYSRIFLLGILLITICVSARPEPAFANEIPFSVQQAIVWVHCGNRQGSGVVVNANQGYILTNAHIVLNLKTNQPETCEVAFITAPGAKPGVYYEADWEQFVYDESRNQDFALLKIGAAKQNAAVHPFPFLQTDEFSKVQDPITVIGFPSKAQGIEVTTTGTIQGLEQGIIKTNAEISPGSSGGAGINSNHHLIGIPTRILYRQISPGVEELVDYELVDIRAVFAWLDTFGADVVDTYFTHADPQRYHGPAAYFTQNATLNCTVLAKTAASDAVYCIRPDGSRRAFPNNATYHSWIADFTGVVDMTADEMAQHPLTSIVTMKPGTLIKIPTDPHVYLISDDTGTIRWIQQEARARELFGDGWAGFVKDVPIEFFATYHLGLPIE